MVDLEELLETLDDCACKQCREASAAIRELRASRPTMERMRAAAVAWLDECGWTASATAMKVKCKKESESFDRHFSPLACDGGKPLACEDCESVEALRERAERAEAERNEWKLLVNDAERAIGMESVASVPDARSLVEWCDDACGWAVKLKLTEARVAELEARPALDAAAPDCANCDALKQAEAKSDGDGLLEMSNPWPLRDVLAKLANAVDHLQHEHNCDCHGHEEIAACRERAREIANKIDRAAAIAAAEAEASEAKAERDRCYGALCDAGMVLSEKNAKLAELKGGAT